MVFVRVDEPARDGAGSPSQVPIAPIREAQVRRHDGVTDQRAVVEAVLRGADLFGEGGLDCARCHTPPMFTSHGFANNGLDAVSIDPGRWRLTGEPADSGAFKIPTLRNIGFTAPYMHDGRFDSLGDVIDHYATGGAGHAHQDTLLTPFSLTDVQRADLLAFLAALNDTAFVGDARWRP